MKPASAASVPASTAAPRAADEASAREQYGKLPISFEANRGQSDASVKFLSRGPGYSLFLTPTEAVLSLRAAVADDSHAKRAGHLPGESTPTTRQGDVVRLSFVGANQSPAMQPIESLGAKTNYLHGNDPSQWQRDVTSYAKVRYSDLYPGVDLLYYGNQRQLEYDLIVAPGVDPGRIALNVDGVNSLQIDAHGNLVFGTSQGDIVQHRPIVYQQVNGQRRDIDASYAMQSGHRVGFRIGDYDASEPLVIDPVLVYSSYLGGSLGDKGNDIAVDASKNAYIVGTTNSNNFPTKGPYQSTNKSTAGEVFVAKFSPTGTLLYSTYIGGVGQDEGAAIAVDSAGNAYITGGTTSLDYPTVSPFQASLGGSQDAFVTKLNAAGNGLVYSTFLGGNVNTNTAANTGDYGYAIALDSSNNAYVTGYAVSTNFPTVNPIQSTGGGLKDDVFVTKFNATGNALVYSTYLGGTEYDEGYAIAVDSAGSAYVTGTTLSSNFPVASAKQQFSGANGDAFISKLSAAGNSLVYSTFLGGISQDVGYGIVVDSAGSAYVGGVTYSANFPVVTSIQPFNGGISSSGSDGFLTKISAAGNAWVYSTYIGGSGSETGIGVAVDSAGNAYVAGQTNSTNFPTVAPIQAANGGLTDGFLTKIASTGSSMVYSTYIGGASDDYANEVAVDSAGDAYITGQTSSTNFPTMAPAQAAKTGSSDAFVARISTSTDVSLAIGDVNISEGNSGTSVATFTISLSKTLTQAVSFNIATANGSALSGSDYVANSVTGASIPAGTLSTTFSVTVNGDTGYEPDENFFVNISALSGATLADGQAVGTIVNDDAFVSPSLTIADVNVTEGNSGTTTATFTVTLAPTATTAVSFNIGTADGTATAGSDYVANSATGLSIAAGTSTKTFTVTINGDTTPESNETFFVNLSAASGATISDGQAVGTINNDDVAPTPSLSINDVRVVEGNAGTSLATFTVSLSASTTSAVTFNAFTSNNTAASGTDYVALNSTGLSIPAGSTSAAVSVTVNGDTTVEADETFFLNIGTVVGATVLDGQGQGTIANDDSVVLPTLSIGDVAVTEGNTGTSLATFTVSLSAVPASAISFDIATSDGSATAGSDYVALALTGQTIAAGVTSKTFNVTINGDKLYEGNETFNVNVSNVVNATIADGTAVGTINNDDTSSASALSIANVTVTEGNSGTAIANFSVILSQPSDKAVTFNVYTSNGTASAGSDYLALNLTGQSIPAGGTSNTFSVAINGDTVVEGNETFFFNVSGLSGATLSNGQAQATIANDDAAGTPTLSIDDVSTDEGNSGTHLATVTVSLSPASANPVSFNLATANSTATAGSDFVAASWNNQTIAAGQTSKSFTITINGDTTVEANEVFPVNISNASGATVENSMALVTIVNDDTVQPPTLSIGDVTVAEGNSGTTVANFTLSLTQPVDKAVSFNVATANGTATAGSDYTALNLTGQSIPAGSTSVNVAVTIAGDTTVEPNETFFVNLSNVSGVTLADGQAQGTISNDDVALTTPISTIQGSGPVSLLEGDSVSTDGVVTATTSDGFYLQSADAKQDGDAATAEGLFVASAEAVSVGDEVRASGRVIEAQVGDSADQLTLTELAATAVSVLSQGNALPRAITLDASNAGANQAITALERFEGMRVSVPSLSVVAPVGGSINERTGAVRSNGRFYGVAAGVARPFREPGLSVLERAAGKSGVSPQLFDANPERLLVNSLGQRGARALAADTGDTISGLVGVLGYGNGAYQVLPDPSAAISVVSGARPKAVTTPTAAQATIGSFNLRRFFDDAKTSSEPVLGANAYATRLAKTANVICAYAKTPDILGVAEVENQAALADLAAAVNGRDGNVLFPGSCTTQAAYSARLLPGSDNRNLGFLVNTVAVRPGVPRVEVLSVTAQGKATTFRNRDGSTELLNARAPLVLSAKINDAAGKSVSVTVIANQLSALEGNLSAPGTHGWATQGDYLRAKRAAQAGFLAGLVQARQNANPSEKLVVLGDFEANEFSDGHADVLGLVSGRPTAGNRVLSYLRSPVSSPLSNLTTRLPKAERYTVSRDGNAQAVDHILVNAALLKASPGAHAEVARINADFGEDNFSDSSVPMRVSDHDPVVMYLQTR